MDRSRLEEVEFSRYSFEVADTDLLFNLFRLYEEECRRCHEARCVLPAYDYCLKCSHTFNLLDSRGAISVTERVALIARVRALAVATARLYLEDSWVTAFCLSWVWRRCPPKSSLRRWPSLAEI